MAKPDTPDDKQFDQWMKGQDELNTLYKEAANEQPPAIVDRKILDEAGEAHGWLGNATLRRYTIPFSAAAAVLIVVAITLDQPAPMVPPPTFETAPSVERDIGAGIEHAKPRSRATPAAESDAEGRPPMPESPIERFQVDAPSFEGIEPPKPESILSMERIGLNDESDPTAIEDPRQRLLHRLDQAILRGDLIGVGDLLEDWIADYPGQDLPEDLRIRIEQMSQ
ncbi:MAG: hypothetical protein DHS20C11_35680 [Lysobacteraceae bacterium]|nr:MAG: hypothetical protein DHS20C11_35680 [Xanthomonadaceae bacterium]